MKTLIAVLILASTSSFGQTTGGGTGTIGGSGSVGPATTGGGGGAIVYNTTLTAETAVNVAACGSPLPSWCAALFPGWTDTYALSTSPPSAPILTSVYNPAPMRISKGRGTQYDVHTLTTHPTALHLVHTQHWFNEGGSSTVVRDGITYPYNTLGHMKVGHTSSTTAYNNAVVQDLWERGFDGVMGNWGGGAQTCGSPAFTDPCSTGKQDRDGAYLMMLDAMAASHPSMKFMFIYDQSAFKSSGNCTTKNATQPTCIEGKMRADWTWAKNNFFSYSQYLRDSTNRPYMGVFIAVSDTSHNMSQCTTATPCVLKSGASCTSNSTCWNGIYNGTMNYMATTQGTPISLIYQAASGFTKVQSGGAFQWDHFDTATGNSITTATQLNWNRSGTIDDFYAQGATNSTKSTFGIGKKGDDQHIAGWHFPLGRVLAQRCGQTLLDTVAKADGKGSYVRGIQYATWDDYEEGTEVETGIDNCYTAPTLSNVGLALTVTLHPTDTTYAGAAVNNRAIQDFTLFVSVDGTNLAQLALIAPPPNSNSFVVDLASFTQLVPATSYQFFVRQNGKPMMKQIMSSSITIVR